jgi:hypothetical protein
MWLYRVLKLCPWISCLSPLAPLSVSQPTLTFEPNIYIINKKFLTLAPTSGDDISGASALDAAGITPLGLLLSRLPLDTSAGRLVALGARCGRLVAQCVVVAVAATMQDLFVMPHPSATPERWVVHLAVDLCDCGVRFFCD